MTLPSRPWRVGGILALLAWSLSAVPDRVQTQRAAVARLADERGAASAGGALLAVLDDLGRYDTSGDTWRFIPGEPAPLLPQADAAYADLVAGVRQNRAWRAMASVPAGTEGATLAEVDGDLFLVLSRGRLPAGGPTAGLGAMTEAPEPPPPPTESPFTPVAAPTTPADAGAPDPFDVPVPADAPVAPDAPVTPDAPVAPEAPVPPEAAVPAEAPVPAEAGAPQVERRPDGSIRVRAGSLVIPAIDLAELHTPGFTLPPVELTLSLPPGAIPAITTPPIPPLADADATTLVAWWPPVQARVEALSGVPLQVGGDPPRAHAILPGFRLSGLPVWSLPTPDTEAAFDLFDGGSVLWLLLLGGLLGREYVTWRREDNRERERQAARDTILQRLSHELRTPAASVRTLVDALDHPGTTEAERAQFLDLVRSEAERLSSGIDRLLQAARGVTDVPVDPIPLDLAEWAASVRQRWVARLPGLTVTGSSPCPAVADPERLDEAVDALLDNARKYGGPNVVLTVAPGRISVEDDGEGVPAKDRARILQKFERVEGRVNDPGGHGLGLWAVGEVARAHGGRLSIEGGSRFVMTLGGRS